MDEAAVCPKCEALSRSRHEQTAGWCPRCKRWQFLYQASFWTFHSAVFRHLACVACGESAWCRDMRELPEGGACAYNAHVHAVGDACDARR
jgi:hypothetical protein